MRSPVALRGERGGRPSGECVWELAVCARRGMRAHSRHLPFLMQPTAIFPPPGPRPALNTGRSGWHATR
eukprot:325071-Chlamydomonas_euryale.AAC.11